MVFRWGRKILLTSTSCGSNVVQWVYLIQSKMKTLWKGYCVVRTSDFRFLIIKLKLQRIVESFHLWIRRALYDRFFFCALPNLLSITNFSAFNLKNMKLFHWFKAKVVNFYMLIEHSSFLNWFQSKYKPLKKENGHCSRDTCTMKECYETFTSNY